MTEMRNDINDLTNLASFERQDIVPFFETFVSLYGHNSPVGRPLIGLETGDVVTTRVPAPSSLALLMIAILSLFALSPKRMEDEDRKAN